MDAASIWLFVIFCGSSNVGTSSGLPLGGFLEQLTLQKSGSHASKILLRQVGRRGAKNMKHTEKMIPRIILKFKKQDPN